MSWIRSDTDGILDKCAECGAHAGWRPTINGDGPEWSASCTDCPNQTPFVATKFDAAVLWNKAQRKKNMRRRDWTRSISALDALIYEHSPAQQARHEARLESLLSTQPTTVVNARNQGQLPRKGTDE